MSALCEEKIYAGKQRDIVGDSQEDDSDYDFDQDLKRFKERRLIFEQKARQRLEKMQNLKANATRATNFPIGSNNIKTSRASKLSGSLLPEYREPSPLSDPGSSSDDEVSSFLNPIKNMEAKGSEAKANKFSMANILAQSQIHKARDEEIQRAQKLWEENETVFVPSQDVTNVEASNHEVKAKDHLNLPGVLANKQNASETPKWQFFGSDADSIWNHEVSSGTDPGVCFGSPIDEYTEIGPSDMALNDAYIWRDFFVSGNVLDELLDGTRCLTRELQFWLLENLCVEADQELSTAYLNVIMALGEKFSGLLSKEVIVRLFGLLGGSKAALDLQSAVQPEISVEDISVDTRWKTEILTSGNKLWNVSLFLKALARLSHSLSDSSLRTIWSLSIRLALDERMKGEHKCHADIGDLLERVLEEIEQIGCSVTENILLDMRMHILERTFQIRVLNIIPVTSVFTHKFRRRLALIFFSQNEAYIREQLEPNKITHDIFKMLASKEIRIPKGEPYFRVCNIVDMINIAVDDVQWRSRPLSAKDAKNHEALLDKLIAQLKRSKDSIQEGTDLNIEKSNAKDSFEQLISRLRGLKTRIAPSQTLMDRYFRRDMEA